MHHFELSLHIKDFKILIVHKRLIELLSVSLWLKTYFVDWTHGLLWKQILNTNPDVIHLTKYWRYHYQATIAGTALPLQFCNMCNNKLEYTYSACVIVAIKHKIEAIVVV